MFLARGLLQGSHNHIVYLGYRNILTIVWKKYAPLVIARLGLAHWVQSCQYQTTTARLYCTYQENAFEEWSKNHDTFPKLVECRELAWYDIGLLRAATRGTPPKRNRIRNFWRHSKYDVWLVAREKNYL